jgi:hypothetical protein
MRYPWDGFGWQPLVAGNVKLSVEHDDATFPNPNFVDLHSVAVDHKATVDVIHGHAFQLDRELDAVVEHPPQVVQALVVEFLTCIADPLGVGVDEALANVEFLAKS